MTAACALKLSHTCDDGGNDDDDDGDDRLMTYCNDDDVHNSRARPTSHFLQQRIEVIVNTKREQAMEWRSFWQREQTTL